jgi:hypothetical protein
MREILIFLAQVAMQSAKEKLKFGFSGGIFAQTKSKKKFEFILFEVLSLIFF